MSYYKMRKVPDIKQFMIRIAAVSSIGFVWANFTCHCVKTIIWIAENPDLFVKKEEEKE